MSVTDQEAEKVVREIVGAYQDLLEADGKATASAGTLINTKLDDWIPTQTEVVVQALTKARQHPACTPSTRCIICSECEAKIVERQKEKSARIIETWAGDDKTIQPSFKKLAQAVRETK